MPDPRRDGADPWLDNFGYVLEPSAIAALRKKPAYQAFTGAKWLAFPWLVVAGTVAGALGGVLVSGALWSVWWKVPLAFLGAAAFTAVILRATLAAYERPIASLAGWCLFFGLLIGAFTMWAAQVESSGWAYGIAGGAVFLLIGITGGDLPPPNGKGMEDWYLTSAFAAPAASCLAVYLYRSGLDDGGIAAGGISSAAVAGGLAGALFMSVLIGLYLLAWKPGRGLLNLATLCLHSDETAPEAVKLFQRLLEVEQPTAELYARSGLAHALAGDAAAAEKDWAKAAELEPDGVEPAMSRGWSALRRRDPEAAAHSFRAALERRGNEVMALVGLGLMNLASANGAAALDALRRRLAEIRRQSGEGHPA